MTAEPSDGSRARVRPVESGDPPPHERMALAARFGPVLRAERGHLRQQQLADLAGLNVDHVQRLETGYRRPTTSSIWRIARALRSDLRSRVALDERLREAAGESLRHVRGRPHARRERIRLELRLEAGERPAVGRQDQNLGALVLADLARMAARGRTGQEQR